MLSCMHFYYMSNERKLISFSSLQPDLMITKLDWLTFKCWRVTRTSRFLAVADGVTRLPMMRLLSS